jgi:hypothetical protein
VHAFPPEFFRPRSTIGDRPEPSTTTLSGATSTDERLAITSSAQANDAQWTHSERLIVVEIHTLASRTSETQHTKHVAENLQFAG